MEELTNILYSFSWALCYMLVDSVLAKPSFHFNPIRKVVSLLPNYLTFLEHTKLPTPIQLTLLSVI